VGRRALYALPPRGITVWALCVVASFEGSSDVSSTAACTGFGPPTPVVGGGSASPASHAPCRSTKDRGPKFLCT